MRPRIWCVFPTGNSEAGQRCADAWTLAGVEVACMIDPGQPLIRCDWLLQPSEYPGYVAAQNELAALAFDNGATAVLIGADDIHPGTGVTADALSTEIVYHGRGAIIQATGDRYEAMSWCAPFPLITREAAARLNDGRHVYHPGYRHFFADQELRDVAIAASVYIEEPRLKIEHRHHTRGHADTLPAEKRQAASARHEADRLIYEQRLALGFPGAWQERTA